MLDDHYAGHQCGSAEIVIVLLQLTLFHYPEEQIVYLQDDTSLRIFLVKGHWGHVYLIWGSLLIFMSTEADDGQAPLVLKLNYLTKTRFRIVHHYQGVRSHYPHGDVLRSCILRVAYSHIIRVKKRQTVICARGRQTVLPFHFKENLTTGSGFTSRQVQWLNQSWSQRTRSFTKLQLMLPCVSIVQEKK